VDVSIPLIAIAGLVVYLAYRYMGLRVWHAIVALIFGLFAHRAGTSGHGETATIVVAACFAAAATIASTLRLVDFRHIESS